MRRRGSLAILLTLVGGAFALLLAGATWLVWSPSLSVDVRVISGAEYEQLARHNAFSAACPGPSGPAIRAQAQDVGRAEPLGVSAADPASRAQAQGTEVRDGMRRVTLDGQNWTDVEVPWGGDATGEALLDSSSGFAAYRGGCGDLHIARYDAKGKRMWDVETECHAHSHVVLAEEKDRLFAYVFQWYANRSYGSAVVEYDWATGTQVRVVPLGMCHAEAMALDLRQETLYIRAEGSRRQRIASRLLLAWSGIGN